MKRATLFAGLVLVVLALLGGVVVGGGGPHRSSSHKAMSCISDTAIGGDGTGDFFSVMGNNLDGRYACSSENSHCTQDFLSYDRQAVITGFTIVASNALSAGEDCIVSLEYGDNGDDKDTGETEITASKVWTGPDATNQANNDNCVNQDVNYAVTTEGAICTLRFTQEVGIGGWMRIAVRDTAQEGVGATACTGLNYICAITEWEEY